MNLIKFVYITITADNAPLKGLRFREQYKRLSQWMLVSNIRLGVIVICKRGDRPNYPRFKFSCRFKCVRKYRERFERLRNGVWCRIAVENLLTITFLNWWDLKPNNLMSLWCTNNINKLTLISICQWVGISSVHKSFGNNGYF